MLNNKHNSRLNGWERCSQPFFFGDIKTGLDGEHGSFGGKTEEHVFFERHENMRTCFFEKTEEHENMLFLKRQKNRRTGFLKTEEWVSVGGYGIPAIPTQT